MDILLHHYAQSPFSEKIRLALAYKELAWGSVIIPPIMPKPNLMPLTGGYRKTPVMQIGQHIICDSLLMTKVLDQIQPAKTLFPAAQLAAVEALSRWGDGEFFRMTLPIAFQPEGLPQLFAGFSEDVLANFAGDRQTMFKDASVSSISTSMAKRFLQINLPKFETTLNASGAYFFGAEPTAADFSIYHPLWFVDLAGLLPDIIEDFPAVKNWFGLLSDLSSAATEEIADTQALTIAKEDTTDWQPLGSPIKLVKAEIGSPVAVIANDYGKDPVVGELIACTTEEIIIKRDAEVNGESTEVYVHFPQFGFEIKKA